MLHGSINHVSVTVRDLDQAMVFFSPILRFLGYSIGEVMHYESADTRLTVNLNSTNGIAFNVWEAKPELAQHKFDVYEPGLHHIAFNVASRSQVDELHALLTSMDVEILDGPAEFPFADDGLGYYAIYFLGPDNLKFECVHMPGLERAFREKRIEG